MMNTIMYSLNFQVTTSACNREGRLKLYSALQMMQDCSELWLDSEPVALDFFNSHHMTQLLASRQVEVVRVPFFKEHLTVTTSVYGIKPMFGFRNTFIYDARGRVCFKSWAMGAFVNLDTGKLHAIDANVLDTIFLDKKLEMNYRDRRISYLIRPEQLCRPSVCYVPTSTITSISTMPTTSEWQWSFFPPTLRSTA